MKWTVVFDDGQTLNLEGDLWEISKQIDDSYFSESCIKAIVRRGY